MCVTRKCSQKSFPEINHNNPIYLGRLILLLFRQKKILTFHICEKYLKTTKRDSYLFIQNLRILKTKNKQKLLGSSQNKHTGNNPKRQSQVALYLYGMESGME